MKYPGIAPAGSGLADSGWALAGTDLRAAEDRLRTPTTTVERVQLAEVLRRRFAFAAAVAVLRDAPDRQDPLLLLAEANVLWARGDATAARPLYRRARRRWSAGPDADARTAAALGLARCARVNYRPGSRRLAARAGALADGRRDVHLRADADRERAAWALLSGDHETALTLATRALEVHETLPDRHLAGLSQVLRARALHELGRPETGVTLMRAQVEEAVRIGSVELDCTATPFLGQFLQRGASRDSERWEEAEAVLTAGLTRAVDPFTRAELILPLAQLHTAGGDVELAEEELAEYARLYTLLGGNLVASANLAKARARLNMARGGGLPPRVLRTLPGRTAAAVTVLRELRHARRAYRAAGLMSAQLGVQWHIDLVDVLATGRVPADGGPVPSGAGGPLDQARMHLLAGEVKWRTGELTAAREQYAAAERAAVSADATLLAIGATTGAAEVAHALGERAQALAALRSTVGHVERIRASVVSGAARGNVASVLRKHYERALVLAARAGDGELALELVERLRTERLAGLLHRAGAQLAPEVVAVLERLNAVDLASLHVEAGVRAAVPGRVLREMGPLDADALSARRAVELARLAELTSRLFADTYGAEPLTAELLAEVEADVLAVVPVTDDDTDHLVAVLRSGDDGRSVVTLTPVEGDLAGLRDVLSARGSGAAGARSRLTSRELRPVADALPDMPPASGRPRPLIVVPTGWLWAVPFAALPVSWGGLLIDHADLVLTPSLRFHQAQVNRFATRPRSRAAASFTDPDARDIAATEVRGLDAHPNGHTKLERSQVREAFVRGSDRWGVAVVAAHGNRDPGLGQAVLAGGRPALTAADFLDGEASPPPLISFASCHSAYPEGDDQHEPLGLAIAAIAAGADAVLSAHIEIDAEEGPLTECLGRVYADLAMCDDLAGVLAAALRDRTHRGADDASPLYRWAALTVIGTHQRGSS